MKGTTEKRLFVAEECMPESFWKHRVYTSTAYRYSREDWSDDENKAVYGKDASWSGVGYNLIVEAKVSASAVSENLLRDRLREVSRLIDHKFLNQDIEDFQEGPVTLEKIALFIRKNLSLEGAQVRLTEAQRCSVETLPGPELALTVYEKINAVHKHWNPDMSQDENKKLYGKCSGLHGHEYNVEVSVQSTLDPKSGLVASRDELHSVLHEAIVKPLDGSYLNDHLGNTSGEKIAFQLMERVKKCTMTQQPYRIVVRETRKNSFKVGAAFF